MHFTHHGVYASGERETDFMYNIRQVSNIIKRYRELRSAVELGTIHHEKVSGNSPKSGKEDLLCALADFDNAFRLLPPRQKIVIRLLIQGWHYEDICCLLGVSLHTVKYHTRHGIIRMTTFLNSSRLLDKRAL